MPSRQRRRNTLGRRAGDGDFRELRQNLPVGFRRSKAAAQERMKWHNFVAAHADLFRSAGLPESLADRERFFYFMEHGYLDDGSGFSTTALSCSEQEALRELTRRFVATFETDGDVETYFGWLALRIRKP
jgi:hypothetical protein